MPNVHRIMLLAFGLLAAIAFVHGANLAFAPHVLQVEAEPAPGSEVATPNHDPHHGGLMSPSTAETAEAPDQVPPHAKPKPSFALSMMTLRAEPEPAAATPEPAIARPEPKPAPAFAAADTTLYARDRARLRAAPSTTADVLAELVADAPLRAVARSSDGAWWRVSLADGRIGYVHRVAVTDIQAVKAKPPAAPAPAFAVATPQPVSARHSQGLRGYLDYVDQTMTWLADQAGGGSAPKMIRPER
jgi:hypothetical protein